MTRSLVFFLVMGVSYINFLICQNTLLTIEYDTVFTVDFLSFGKPEGIYHKINLQNESNLNSPQGWLQSHISESDSTWSLMLVKDSSTVNYKNSEHYDYIKRANVDSTWVECLHGLYYNYNGKNVCKMRYYYHVAGIPYDIGNLVELEEIRGKWLKANVTRNHQYLWHFLFNMKSCILANLLQPEPSGMAIFDSVYFAARDENDVLSISKLYSLSKEFSDLERSTFYATESNDCPNGLNDQDSVRSKISYIGYLDNVRLVRYDDEDYEDVDSLRRIIESRVGIDSIRLTTSLILGDASEKHQIIKYLPHEGTKTKEVYLNLSRELSEKKSRMRQLTDVYAALPSEVFYDLLGENPNRPKRHDNLNYRKIYDKSRGMYGLLNISKLYNLLFDEPELFEGMLSN